MTVSYGCGGGVCMVVCGVCNGVRVWVDACVWCGCFVYVVVCVVVVVCGSVYVLVCMF